MVDEGPSNIPGAAEIGPPKFQTQVASSIEISEGQSAHFEARLTPTEDPNMKVRQIIKNREQILFLSILSHLIYIILNRLSGLKMELHFQLVTDSEPSMTLVLSSLIFSTVMEKILELMNAAQPTSWVLTPPRAV